MIVSSSTDTTLKVHSLEETKTLRIYSKRVNCVRYCIDIGITDDLLYGDRSDVIVSSSRDTTLKVHSLEETKTLRIDSKPVNCVRYV